MASSYRVGTDEGLRNFENQIQLNFYFSLRVYLLN